MSFYETRNNNTIVVKPIQEEDEEEDEQIKNFYEDRKLDKNPFIHKFSTGMNRIV